MLYSGLYNRLINAPAVIVLLDDPPNSLPIANAVYFGAAGKEPPQRFVVINLVNGPPAETTLDGSSTAIAAEIQLDSYAEDQLNVRALSQAVRDTLKDYGGTLSDGTVIQFVEVTMDHDAGYEVGGLSYIFRATLRLKAFYTETGIAPPPLMMRRYTFTPAPNGVLNTFTLAVPLTANTQVFRNGQLLDVNNDYTFLGNSVTFGFTPAPGDVLTAFQF